MDDLTAFITARLDEDEAVAKAATIEHLGTWRPVWILASDAARIVDTDGMLIGGSQLRGEAEHIARHDPARVLREVTAKRAMVAQHSRNPGTVFDACDWCSHEAADYPWPCPTIRAIAAIWNDHPDYQPQWAPETAP